MYNRTLGNQRYSIMQFTDGNSKKKAWSFMCSLHIYIKPDHNWNQKMQMVTTKIKQRQLPT